MENGVFKRLRCKVIRCQSDAKMHGSQWNANSSCLLISGGPQGKLRFPALDYPLGFLERLIHVRRIIEKVVMCKRTLWENKTVFFFTFDTCKPVVGDSKTKLGNFKIA